MKSAFFIIPYAASRRLGHRFIGLGYRVAKIMPGLKYDLQQAREDIDIGEYVAVVLLNAVVWAGLLFTIIFALLVGRGIIKRTVLAAAFSSAPEFLAAVFEMRLAFLPAAVAFIGVTAFLLYYPHVQAKKIGELVDKDLVFALKDLSLQVGSGVSLFNGMANVAKAGYGAVSKEFETVVREIETGEGEDLALEKMALRTESEFLRKMIWQIVTALRSGSSMQSALRGLVTSLDEYQKTQIKEYTGELNLWALMYMVFAVAIPGLGSTLLIVLSTFGGIPVTETIFIYIISFCFMVEIVIIELIKTRRPAVHI